MASSVWEEAVTTPLWIALFSSWKLLSSHSLCLKSVSQQLAPGTGLRAVDSHAHGSIPSSLSTSLPAPSPTLRGHSGQVFSFTATPQILPRPLLFSSPGGTEFLSELCSKLTAFLLRIGHHYFFFFFLSVLSPFFRFLRKESGDLQMLLDRTDEATKLCFRPEERKDWDCFIHVCFPSLIFHARKS